MRSKPKKGRPFTGTTGGDTVHLARCCANWYDLSEWRTCCGKTMRADRRRRVVNCKRCLSHKLAALLPADQRPATKSKRRPGAVPDNYSEVIKRLRRDLKLTQTEIATIIDTSPQTVSNWELGLCRPNPYAWRRLMGS